MINMCFLSRFVISSVLLAWVSFLLHLFCQLHSETPSMVLDYSENISNGRLYLEIKGNIVFFYSTLVSKSFNKVTCVSVELSHSPLLMANNGANLRNQFTIVGLGMLLKYS